MESIMCCTQEKLEANFGQCCGCEELSIVKDANKQVQDLIDKLGPEIKERSKGSSDYTHLKAINYKTQNMLGTNYFIKASTSDGGYMHLRIYTPDDGGRPELYGIRHDVKADEEIEYF